MDTHSTEPLYLLIFNATNILRGHPFKKQAEISSQEFNIPSIFSSHPAVMFYSIVSGTAWEATVHPMRGP
jgi:hypothetical protein